MTPDEQRQTYANGVAAGVASAHDGEDCEREADPLWTKGYRDGRRWFLRRVASLMVVESEET